MEWFWNGFYGGLGYAASGVAIVAAVGVLALLWLAVAITIEALKGK